VKHEEYVISDTDLDRLAVMVAALTKYGEEDDGDEITEPVTDGYCRTCEWCDEAEQLNGFCHAHPYVRKPTDAETSDSVHPRERVPCFPVVIPSMGWCDKWRRDGKARTEPASPPPVWCCYDCGVEEYGPAHSSSTWHAGTCGICGKVTGVTEPRDFG
jgi:hypothetical protein